ncbi:SIS domain-containing protein [bacterium]|nr:MAG: SIS domain-containing protein [bacterium]
MEINSFIDQYLKETKEIADIISRPRIAMIIEALQKTKDNKGRLFIIGVGGSAANASHAVNDFRKISGMECYSPVDNVSELTAWTNDVGFESVFIKWLETSRLGKRDCLMVLSVGGGTETTSKNLVLAMRYAKEIGANIVAVVSRDGGMAAKLTDGCVIVPVVSDERITPHAEGWQGLLLHLIVNSIR